MKNSTKDQVQGKVHEVKGTLKEKAGQISNSPGLEVEGQMEKRAGKCSRRWVRSKRYLRSRASVL